MQISKAASGIQEPFCSLGHLGCSGFWLGGGPSFLKWLIDARIPGGEASAGPPCPGAATAQGRLTSR